MSIIGLVPVKKYILHFIQGGRTVRGIGQGLSDFHHILYKYKLMDAWIKRREVVNDAWLLGGLEVGN